MSSFILTSLQRPPNGLFLPQAGTLRLTGPGGTDSFEVGPQHAPEVVGSKALFSLYKRINENVRAKCVSNRSLEEQLSHTRELRTQPLLSPQARRAAHGGVSH